MASPALAPTSAACWPNSLLRKTLPAPSPTKGDGEEEVAPETPVTGKKKSAGRKRKGSEIWFASHGRAGLTSSVDAVEGDTAEDTPLKKKMATPSKAKGKALASAAKLEDESSPVKKEVDEASEDDA